MQILIAYQCNHCLSKQCEVIDSGPHKKLNCIECGKHVKFIGKDELQKYMSLEPVSAQEVEKMANVDPIAEISFKIDLIIDHLNIKL